MSNERTVVVPQWLENEIKCVHEELMTLKALEDMKDWLMTSGKMEEPCHRRHLERIEEKLGYYESVMEALMELLK